MTSSSSLLSCWMLSLLSVDDELFDERGVVGVLGCCSIRAGASILLILYLSGILGYVFVLVAGLPLWVWIGAWIIAGELPCREWFGTLWFCDNNNVKIWSNSCKFRNHTFPASFKGSICTMPLLLLPVGDEFSVVGFEDTFELKMKKFRIDQWW